MSSVNRHRLTERDLQVPGLLEDYKMLTTSQIQQLLYPTLQKAQTRLLKMHKAGLVKRFAYPVLLSEGGRGEYVYHVNSKPKVALTAVQHTIQLNEVRIAFEIACRNSDKINLVGFIPEYRGKVKSDGRPGRNVEESVADPGAFGQETTIIPDAVICLGNSEIKKSALFFLEVDLGSEKLITEGRGKYSVLKKMLVYREYLEARGFERYDDLFRFPFKGFRVLTVMNNTKRIQRLRRELTQRGIKKFIWFTEDSTINQHNIFKKIWLIADANDSNNYSIIGR